MTKASNLPKSASNDFLAAVEDIRNRKVKLEISIRWDEKLGCYEATVPALEDIRSLGNSYSEAAENVERELVEFFVVLLKVAYENEENESPLPMLRTVRD